MQPVFQIIDEHIASGRGADARRVLKKLAEGKIAREDRWAVANLARRANLQGLAVQLLNPIVRPKGKKLNDATDREKAEYAASLTYLGAADEARVLLKQIDPKASPESLLFQAFACFGQWNYAEAIPVLKKFIQNSQISDYQRLVGKVNLAAALVYEKQSTDAEDLLEETRRLTDTEKFKLLHGNCLELSAQNAIHQKAWGRAFDFLARAQVLLENTDSDEYFFVAKWKAIAEFMQDPTNEKNLSQLHRIRTQAQSQKNWETVRDCDRFEAICGKNEKLLAHLYFGTPYESFRSRLIDDFKPRAQLPSSYAYVLGSGKGAGGSLNLLTGEESRKAARLKVGQAPHRLLLTLASDFYKPARVAVVHAKLFPGEFFNPITAPPRVYEIVRRLKAWFREHRVPLSVVESVGYYSLHADEKFTIQIELSPVMSSRSDNFGEQLKRAWPEAPFSLNEASRTLSVSTRSALRVIDGLRKSDVLSRVGKGPATRYQFKKVVSK